MVYTNTFLVQGETMIPEFHVDKVGDTPVYRQVAEKIIELIGRGELKNGERLPPEREMAERLAVARGTIKKAYEELALRRVVVPARGRGTFIAAGVTPADSGRLDKAGRLIDALLANLEELRFSPQEIGNLIHLKISERQEKKAGIFIAAVDCNPESLDMFRRQIAVIARLEVKKVLLHELKNAADAERKLRDFELILCTATHYEDLTGLVPSLKKRIVRVVVSPSQQTILDLAGMTGSQKIGILCRSPQFMEIIRRKLPDYGVSPADAEGLLVGPGADVAGFIRDKHVVIIPPGYSFEIGRENKALIQRFTESGGRLVPFDYRIEKGSLLHLEERIRSLIAEEAAG